METKAIPTFCYIAALLLLIGIIISGIPGNLLIYSLEPQPAWVNIETYAANFHPLQMMPIFGQDL